MFNGPTAHICLWKYIFGIAVFAQPIFLSIYGFTLFQMENWHHNLRFCFCDRNFTEILPKFCPFFAYLRSPTAHLCLSKYIFGIVLFAQPLFQSIYGFTLFQMENFLQNWRFCNFDLNFTQI